MSVADVRVQILKPSCLCALGNTQRRGIVVRDDRNNQRAEMPGVYPSLSNLTVRPSFTSAILGSKALGREVCLYGIIEEVACECKQQPLLFATSPKVMGEEREEEE